MEDIRHRWEDLQERIATVATRAGRNPEEITVVAVTKTRSPQEVETVLESGLLAVGENRVQEAEEKKQLVRHPGQWHLIGHLQTNKAKKAVALFDMVQSVDSLKLATALDQRAAQVDRRLDVLLQVNTSGAVQQSGIAPEALPSLVEQIVNLSHLRIRGLMTIGAHSDEEAEVRDSFRTLYRLRDDLDALRLAKVDLSYLSMGMSGDFEWAIAEGANMLRLGTILFGPRPT